MHFDSKGIRRAKAVGLRSSASAVVAFVYFFVKHISRKVADIVNRKYA